MISKRHGFRRLWPLLVLSAAACDNGPQTDAPLHITLDTESMGNQCESTRFADYDMSCGATVSIRLTDPDTGELLLRDTGEPLSICVQAAPSENMSSLVDLQDDLQLFGMPARTLRVEVAIWNPDDLSGGECPNPARFELFDVLGRPQTTFDPQPAFAGAAYFRAGEEAAITVPLSCPHPALLNIDTCAANLPTDVKASVTDMQTMQGLRREQAPSIAVSVGEAREVSDDQGGSFHVLEAVDTFELSLNNSGATPVYEDDSIMQRFGKRGRLACTTTLEGTAQATTNVFCEAVPDGEATLRVNPVLVRKELVDTVLAAMGQSFPDSGLVIGRVVDEGFSPISGVVVTPESGSVFYLSEDLSDLSPSLSSNSAYFVATDVPFGSSWTASHFDGRPNSGDPRGGIIQGKVSAVIIRMTGSVVGP